MPSEALKAGQRLILLIGASGLLGHNVLRELLKRGFRVRAIVRSEGAIKEAAIPAGKEALLEVQVGNILDFKSLAQLSVGCDAAINCAGMTDMSLLDLDDYIPVNRDLPVALCSIMEKSGSMKTLVDVSSANTIGNGNALCPAREDKPYRKPYSQSLYAQSKFLSEQDLTQWAKEHPDKRVIIVNPGYIIGGFDFKPSSGKLLLAGCRKPLMAAPGGGKSFVAASDAAAAIVNALDRGRSGERYLLTSDNLTFKDLYTIQARLLGYRQLYFKLPRALCLLVGALGSGLRRLGIKTMVSLANVKIMCEEEFYDSTKATLELGLKHSPIEDSINAFWKTML